MNMLLWILQVLFGVYFTVVGVLHFGLPQGLPAAMSWMYELSPALHLVSGTAEILGGLGLVLPGITKIQTRLTPLAGAGLVLVMIGAMWWHAQRGEFQNIVLNLVLAAGAAFIAYGRWKLKPLAGRND
jgi:uncharacterized membrane protein YphA (DoxX/SURF4 family)